MAGVVAQVGSSVSNWKTGDRVSVPFSIGCGMCRSCRSGFLNTCDDGFTPGFSSWGSFAERVAIDHADLNLVRLPPAIDSTAASALGCRFATAYRALVQRAALQPGQWLAVHGCGGVGLSAVMIAVAIGARVVAVDIDQRALDLAVELGAEAVVDGAESDPVAEVFGVTAGGADVSIDAVGTAATMSNSIGSLRKHGRHVQIGLLLGEHANPPIRMEPVIMGEIDILGTRGLAASSYPDLFDFVEKHEIDLGRLVTGTTTLDGASSVLTAMGDFAAVGVTVIDRF